MSHSLISEPYVGLLAEAEGTEEEKVQDLFRCKVQCLRADDAGCRVTMDTTRDRLAGSQEPSHVRSEGEAHIEWGKRGRDKSDAVSQGSSPGGALRTGHTSSPLHQQA